MISIKSRESTPERGLTLAEAITVALLDTGTGQARFLSLAEGSAE